MTLRSKAFLIAWFVAIAFIFSSVFFLFLVHKKQDRIETSLRHLMSKTFAVIIEQAEQDAAKAVVEIEQTWRHSQPQDLAHQYRFDLVALVDATGEPQWSYFANQVQENQSQTKRLLANLFNQTKNIDHLKHGMAYSEQQLLYLTTLPLKSAISPDAESVAALTYPRLIVGYYMESLFQRLQQAYGFHAFAAPDQRQAMALQRTHLTGVVTVPGLVSSPVAIWVEDEHYIFRNLTPFIFVLSLMGLLLGLYLWWFWRKHLISRMQGFIDQAHEINTQQNYDQRIKLTGDDEFNELAGHYNSMISSLEYSYNLMAKSNFITTELISKVKASTEPGGADSRVVAEQSDVELKESLDLVARLSEAVEHEQIELYFQPVIDLPTEKMVQVEALCRWFDADVGMVPPQDFLSLAEKSGQMPGLSKQLLASACSALAEFQQQRAFPVSVNLSSSQLAQPNLINLLQSFMGDAGELRREHLILEIKEHSISRDMDKTSRIIESLKAAGFGICIDDFGLSKFSLMYLQQLPVSQIKLAKVFVDRLDNNHKDAAFIEGIVRFSRGLNIRVIAKGVETEQQLYILKKIEHLDCQGFGLEKPMAQQQFIDWIGEQDER